MCRALAPTLEGLQVESVPPRGAAGMGDVPFQSHDDLTAWLAHQP